MAKKRSVRSHYQTQNDGVASRGNTHSNKTYPIFHGRGSKNSSDEVIPEYPRTLGALRRKLASVEDRIARSEERGEKPKEADLIEKAKIRNDIIALREAVNQKVNEPLIDDLELKENLSIEVIKSELLLDKTEKLKEIEKKEETKKREEERRIEFEKEQAAKKYKGGVSVTPGFFKKGDNKRRILITGSNNQSFYISMGTKNENPYGNTQSIETEGSRYLLPGYVVFKLPKNVNQMTTEAKRLALLTALQGAVEKDADIDKSEVGRYARTIRDNELDQIFNKSKPRQWVSFAPKNDSEGKFKVTFSDNSFRNATNKAKELIHNE